MQSYGPEIPWVRVGQDRFGGYRMDCTACGAVAIAGSVGGVEQFATHHAEHTAGPRHVGLGDAVAKLAKPVARAVGKKPCTPCERRRQALNAVRLRRPW